MNLSIGNLFRRKSSRRKSNRRGKERAYRSLRMESLEHRQLLTAVTLTPVKDNSLIEYQAPKYSGGADPDLYVGLDHIMSTRMRGVMAFDVAGAVPAGAQINSVTLTVWVDLTASTTTGTPNAELHKVTADWGEGTSAPTTFMPPFGRTTTGDATWLHTFYNTALWATAGGDFSPTVSGTTGLGADGTSATWSTTPQMVADVQNWLDDPSTNFGWLLKGDETQESGKMIASRESANAAHRPTLTIDYTLAPTAPTLAIAATDAAKAEGNAGSTPFTFTVTRSGDTSAVTTVNYAVTGSGANAADAADFAGGVLPGGSVSFAAGETSQVVTVNVNGDTTVEPDEGFTVTLSGAVNGTISTATATGTITNDDALPGPTPTIAVFDAAKAEGNSGTTVAEFTLTLSAPSDQPVTVDFATADGTAAVGADYQAASGTVTFAPNETTKTITVNVNGDETVELDESFMVNLSNAAGATLSDSQASGTITNDDAASFSISDVTLPEGNSGTQDFTFTVTLDAAVDVPVTVDFSTADGTATTADGDYAAASGTLDVGGTPGETKTITVHVNGDLANEPNETFSVNLSNVQAGGRNVTIADGQAVGTIANDEQGVTLLPDGTLLVVGSDTARDRITVSADSRGRVFVTYNGKRSGPYDVTGQIEVHGGGNNDRITVSRSVRRGALLDGGDGNDTLYGGSGDDTLDGGAGNDRLYGGTGSDRLDGGDGNDTLYGESGSDNLYGGPAIDVLRGGSADDWLDGGDGNDRLYGGSGNDVLLGGPGNDRLEAGSGRNLLIGGDGKDTVRGGSGESILIGGLTIYDEKDAALAAIMAEWTSTRSFKERRDNLSAGISDPTLGLIQLKAGTTVLNNTTPVRDAIFGSPRRNWIFDFSSGHDDDDDDDHGNQSDHGEDDGNDFESLRTLK